MRERTCCFSGHRPESLPDNGNEHSAGVYAIRAALYEKIDRAVEVGYTHFISGMSRGIDFWMAERVLSLREQNPTLSLEAAIPCDAQADRWSAEDQWRYGEILRRADRVTRVQREYSRDCFQKRNRYMVDSSSLLIAAWNGAPSGTGNCIRYARTQGVKLDIMNISEQLSLWI